MPSRRDILKATGGLVLATGGSWLASHAHAAVPNPPGLAPLPAVAVGNIAAASDCAARDPRVAGNDYCRPLTARSHANRRSRRS